MATTTELLDPPTLSADDPVPTDGELWAAFGDDELWAASRDGVRPTWGYR